jgi:hypothetical protein
VLLSSWVPRTAIVALPALPSRRGHADATASVGDASTVTVPSRAPAVSSGAVTVTYP